MNYTKLARIVLYYQRKTSGVSMGGHRLKVIPHLDYTELTERYKACKEPKERSRWLAIRQVKSPQPLHVHRRSGQYCRILS